MDIYKKGYWAIASQKHLNAYAPDSSNIDEFDNIDLSGKTGRFLGAIRGNTKIDDIKLNTMNDLREYIYTKKPNDEVILQVKRGKLNKQIKIVLGKRY